MPDPIQGKSQELKSWLGALAAVKILEERPDVTLPLLCHERAMTHGDDAALKGEFSELSFFNLSQSINAYACWVSAQGLPPGGTVCLLMHNCPEYAAIWLGISQTGRSVALLNTGLVAESLAHCIAVSSSLHLIYAASFAEVVHAAMPYLPAAMSYWTHGSTEPQWEHPRIDATIDAYLTSHTHIAGGTQPDQHGTAVLIFTSGTTGLPKAVRVTHRRIVEWSCWFAGLLDVQPTDRLYNCLPMYHSTGGIVALGAMLVRGGMVVIRERFSVSGFWDDVISCKSTIFFYIGELCRYLTLAPTSPRETQHCLRLCCGNGLGRPVWEQFQERFGIPRIIEFYAATEGSVSLYNCVGEPGAVGHIPGFLRHNFPVLLVAIDFASGEILRDASGLCRRSGVNEPGEALGRLSNDSSMPARQFDGYTDASASARKIVRNVVSYGDAWFRTGDLMRQDVNGFYFFVERLGDTFRWKGENVSTEEVAGLLRKCDGVLEAVVFGVTVPGCEGRAGMAAITTSESFDLEKLFTHAVLHLPYFARPVFIRICKKLDVTGTFKYRKDRLAAEGYSASNSDPVWVYNRNSLSYIACDAAFQRQMLEPNTLRKMF